MFFITRTHQKNKTALNHFLQKGNSERRRLFTWYKYI